MAALYYSFWGARPPPLAEAGCSVWGVALGLRAKTGRNGVETRVVAEQRILLTRETGIGNMRGAPVSAFLLQSRSLSIPPIRMPEILL
jgi:hypothetical protein